LVAGQRAAVLAGSPDAAGAPKDGAEVKEDPLVGVVTDVTAGEGESAPSVVTMLVDTAAARRAAQIDKPHVVVLSPTGREVP
jgi:hypothetical protein